MQNRIIIRGGIMVKNRLKEIRMREYMMAPGKFAKYLNISIKTYSGWENGHSKPTLEGALIIANKLNKDVKDIKDIWYLGLVS